jgi:CRISPR-associated endonuclease/helicase Cas3
VVQPASALHSLARTLQAAGCTSTVLELSTLRGQRALDTRWRDDPTRPAIVVGTGDMIGSRLLFSAYGRVGPWGRALEAGLLGQDCLLVLDEAHLCSPFATTLTAVERRIGTLAPFAVVRMGATMEPVRDLLQRTPGLPEETTRPPRTTSDRSGTDAFFAIPRGAPTTFAHPAFATAPGGSFS